MFVVIIYKVNIKIINIEPPTEIKSDDIPTTNNNTNLQTFHSKKVGVISSCVIN